MSNPCDTLLQGVEAFNIKELIPNGYIDPVKILSSDQTSETIEVNLLPASEIQIELQYDVRASAGTSLSDLSGDPFVGLGGFAGGAGAGLGSLLGQIELGDLPPVYSKFVYHLADMRTFFNVPIILTDDIIDTGIVQLNNPVAGVFSVTKDQVDFTDEDLQSLGSTGDVNNVAEPDEDGLIKNLKSSQISDNLFIKIIRDGRKIKYRADNSDGIYNNVNAGNGEIDDLTDNKILILIDNEPDEEGNIKYAPGDTIYITYVGVEERFFRQIISTRSIYFYFGGLDIGRIEDTINVYNYKPFIFDAHKDTSKFPDLLTLDSEIEQIEGQRIIETYVDQKNFGVKGIYAADARGIFAIHFDPNNNLDFEVEILLSPSEIDDQDWFNQYLEDLSNSSIFIENGIIPLDEQNFANVFSIFRRLVFDVSDHVNSTVSDTNKYAYLDIFAFSLQNVSNIVGIPNLDLVINDVFGRNDLNQYDLSSAVFDTVSSSSTFNSSFGISDCGIVFNPQQGQFTANNALRTPRFFYNLTENSRIYLELWAPQLRTSSSRRIFVNTNAVGGLEYMSSATDYFSNYGIIAYSNFNNNIYYNIFEDYITNNHLQKVRKLTKNININNIINSGSNLEEKDVDENTILNSEDFFGFDQILGNQPGYSSGIEITTETGRSRKNNLNLISSLDIQNNFFTKSNDSIIIELPPVIKGKRIKSLLMKYKLADFYEFENNRDFYIIFPSSDLVIDNISLGNISNIDSNEEKTFFIPIGNYYDDDKIVIKGSAIKDINPISFNIKYITEEVYNDNSVFSSVITTCFDARSNILIFHEDKDDNDNSNISCLISHNLGNTWFRHNGLVYLGEGQKAIFPKVITDFNKDIIYLFYVLNSSLFCKSFNSKEFLIDDSFIEYTPPTKDDIGRRVVSSLDDFSETGKNLRKGSSYLVEGSLNQEGISLIDDFLFLGIEAKQIAENSFSKGDYSVFVSSKGNIFVLYTYNGYLYIKRSSDGGKTWNYLTDEKGIILHVDANINKEALLNAQEDENNLYPVSNINIIHSRMEKRIYITYIYNNSMYFRSFSESIFESNFIEDVDISSLKLKILNINNPSVYISGIENKNSISKISAVGYATKKGEPRIFYKDNSGYIKAATLNYNQSFADIDIIPLQNL